MLLHFGLTFQTGKPTEKMAEGDVYEGPKEFKRVIVADDHDMAEKIAEVMIGEEVSSNQVIEKVLDVRFTSAEPTMGKFNGAGDVWTAVLAKLELKEGGVKFYTHDAYGYEEYVGFTRIKKVQ